MFICFSRFFSKGLVPMSQFTDIERSLLSKVFLNEDIAMYFKWKRYATNDQITLKDEEFTIISWDNYKKGTGSLEEAYTMAKSEKLDLVLVCRSPPTVRIMNYNNWILRWAFRDIQLKSSSFTKRNSPLFQISHRISDSDLDLKLKRISELLQKHDSVIIDSKVSNEGSFEEMRSLKKFEATFQKKLKSTMSGKPIDIRMHSSDLSVKLVIKRIDSIKTIENYDLALNEPKDERIVSHSVMTSDFGNDEEEYMRQILTGEHNMFDNLGKKNEEYENYNKIEGDVHDQNDFNQDDDENSQIDEELEAIKLKVENLVGKELAEKFLMGRFKLR